MLFLIKMTEHNLKIYNQYYNISSYGTIDFKLLQNIQKQTKKLFKVTFFSKWNNLDQYDVSEEMIRDTNLFYKCNLSNKDDLKNLSDDYMRHHHNPPKLSNNQLYICDELNCGNLPVLPVKTYEEKKLFSDLVKKQNTLDLNKINPDIILKDWNTLDNIKPNVDNKLQVYPKIIEYIHNYLKVYKENHETINQIARWNITTL